MKGADLPGELARLSPSEVIAERRPLRRRLAQALDRACGCGGDAGADGLLRQPRRRSRAEAAVERGRARRLRRLRTGRACRGRRALKVCRADPDRTEARIAAAAEIRFRLAPAHRCCKPREPGIDCARLRARSREACSAPSTAQSQEPARASLPGASPAHCAIRARSSRGSMPSAFSSTRRACATTLRDSLRSAPDLPARVSRLAFARGSPRDLGAVRDALGVAARVLELLAGDGAAWACRPSCPASPGVSGLSADDLHAALAGALVDDPPHLRRDGGFVREGFEPSSTRRAA